MPGSDLVSARYPTTYPFAKLIGRNANASQGNLTVRSNLEWAIGNISDGALAASGVCASVAVPVETGDTFSKVTIIVGATAASTPTHNFAALYSGVAVPALIANSADSLTAAVAASAAFSYTLAASVTITDAIAPNGFIYVSISGTGTAVQTALSIATPTAVGYQWYASGPLFLAATHGSAVAGTPPATIASPAAKAVGPVVFLS